MTSAFGPHRRRRAAADTAGKIAIAPQELRNVKPFHNGLAQVQTKDNGVGYIDRSANTSGDRISARTIERNNADAKMLSVVARALRTPVSAHGLSPKQCLDVGAF